MWVTQSLEKPNVIPGLTRNLCRFFEILAFARMTNGRGDSPRPRSGLGRKGGGQEMLLYARNCVETAPLSQRSDFLQRFQFPVWGFGTRERD